MPSTNNNLLETASGEHNGVPSGSSFLRISTLLAVLAVLGVFATGVHGLVAETTVRDGTTVNPTGPHICYPPVSSVRAAHHRHVLALTPNLRVPP